MRGALASLTSLLVVVSISFVAGDADAGRQGRRKAKAAAWAPGKEKRGDTVVVHEKSFARMTPHRLARRLRKLAKDERVPDGHELGSHEVTTWDGRPATGHIVKDGKHGLVYEQRLPEATMVEDAGFYTAYFPLKAEVRRYRLDSGFRSLLDGRVRVPLSPSVVENAAKAAAGK